MNISKTAFHAAFAGVAALLVGCGSSPNPTPVERGEHAESAPAPLTPAPAVKRTVAHHNPFGDVAATTNYALDGDFELTQSSFESAWYGLSSDLQSFVPFTWATGGRCRSGIACGVIAAGQAALDFDVAVRPLTENTFTFVAQPSGPCADVKGEIDLSPTADGSAYDAFFTVPTSATPGPDGWCSYTVPVSANRPQYQYAVIVLTSASDAIVDDVVFAANSGGGHGSARAGDPARGRQHAALRRVVRDARERASARVLARAGVFGLRGRHD